MSVAKSQSGTIAMSKRYTRNDPKVLTWRVRCLCQVKSDPYQSSRLPHPPACATQVGLVRLLDGGLLHQDR
jgi:hypothetical protein